MGLISRLLGTIFAAILWYITPSKTATPTPTAHTQDTDNDGYLEDVLERIDDLDIDHKRDYLEYCYLLNGARYYSS